MEKKAYISSEMELIEMESELMTVFSGGGATPGDPTISPIADDTDPDSGDNRKSGWDD